MERIQEITECCICADQFKDPRILSCVHTFCLDCLEKTALQRELKSGDSMPCPVCRKPFIIPNEGMAGIQKNFFMKELVEISKSPEDSSHVILCDICQTENVEKGQEIIQAVQFCIQCQQNICNRCSKDHGRFKELKNHQLTDIGSPRKDELHRNVPDQYCDQHKKRDLEMFCVDCQQVICLMCLAQRHKTHNCFGVTETAEEFRKQIRSDLDQVNVFVREVAEKIEEVGVLHTDFQKKIEDTERAIINRSDELKILVDKCKRSLLDELAIIKKESSKNVSSHREENETHKMVLDSFKKYCIELNDKGSDAEICRSAKGLHLRVKELGEIHEKQVEKIFSSTDVYFESSNVEDFLKGGNILGSIGETCDTDAGQTQIGNISKPVVKIRLSGRLDIPSSSLVSGVTKLENRIYVLCQSPQLILVFGDQHPFKKEKQVRIIMIENPVDITHCEKSKCLYVHDESFGECIWKIGADGHRINKWLETDGSIESLLSVTSDGHLMLLTLCTDMFEFDKHQSLEIYGSDAKLMRRIRIENRITRPQHVIKKPNGDFIISHILKRDKGECLAISRLNDGQPILRHFVSKCNTDETNFRNHMALDKENHRLFVGDVLDSRVILLNSDSYDWIPVTEVGKKICRPKALCYDNKQKQLIIGILEGNVDIYQVT